MVSWILILLTLIYGFITVLRWIFGIYIFNWLIPYTRYLYVVLHELSHLIFGLLMGSGVDKVVLLPKDNLFAGYYLGLRESPVTLGFLKIGEALISIAGPLFPPLIIYLMIKWVKKGNYRNILVLLLAFLALILITSPQRWIYLVAFLLLLVIGNYLRKINRKYLDAMILIFVLWAMIGMVDELMVIGGYNSIGSDMGNFTHALLRADIPMISWLLNKGIQAYYLFMFYIYYRELNLKNSK